jgi:hypothetical protein
MLRQRCIGNIVGEAWSLKSEVWHWGVHGMMLYEYTVYAQRQPKQGLRGDLPYSYVASEDRATNPLA